MHTPFIFCLKQGLLKNWPRVCGRACRYMGYSKLLRVLPAEVGYEIEYRIIVILFLKVSFEGLWSVFDVGYLKFL